MKTITVEKKLYIFASPDKNADKGYIIRSDTFYLESMGVLLETHDLIYEVKIDESLLVGKLSSFLDKKEQKIRLDLENDLVKVREEKAALTAIEHKKD